MDSTGRQIMWLRQELDPGPFAYWKDGIGGFEPSKDSWHSPPRSLASAKGRSFADMRRRLAASLDGWMDGWMWERGFSSRIRPITAQFLDLQ